MRKIMLQRIASIVVISFLLGACAAPEAPAPAPPPAPVPIPEAVIDISAGVVVY